MNNDLEIYINYKGIGCVSLKDYNDTVEKLEKEIERLNNIINELEKELNKDFNTYMIRNRQYEKYIKQVQIIIECTFV